MIIKLFLQICLHLARHSASSCCCFTVPAAGAVRTHTRVRARTHAVNAHARRLQIDTNARDVNRNYRRYRQPIKLCCVIDYTVPGRGERADVLEVLVAGWLYVVRGYRVEAGCWWPGGCT